MGSVISRRRHLFPRTRRMGAKSALTKYVHASLKRSAPRVGGGKKEGKTMQWDLMSEAYSRLNCLKKKSESATKRTERRELLIHGNFHLLHQNATAFVLPASSLSVVVWFSLHMKAKSSQSPCVRGDYINCNIIFTFNFILPFAFTLSSPFRLLSCEAA